MSIPALGLPTNRLCSSQQSSIEESFSEDELSTGDQSLDGDESFSGDDLSTTDQSFSGDLLSTRLDAVSTLSARKLFENMVGDIDEPTFPFGIAKVHHDGTEMTEFHSILTQDVYNRLRSQAKQSGFSVASLCHVACALVLARTTGQERVVFGTPFREVLAEKVADPQHVMRRSTNVLPFRCDVGSQSVQECVRLVHTRLAKLLEHEHVSLPPA